MPVIVNSFIKRNLQLSHFALQFQRVFKWFVFSAISHFYIPCFGFSPHPLGKNLGIRSQQDSRRNFQICLSLASKFDRPAATPVKRPRPGRRLSNAISCY